MNVDKIVIAGIGTEVGKTIISSIVVEALQADYWKPVQAGDLVFTDTDRVKSLVSNPKSFFHPEAIRLIHPMSPHASAKKEGIEIDIEKIILPNTSNKLVIELAGGLMVPLNERVLNIDLLKKWKVPVILVSRHYLGSINHTLLSVSALAQFGIPIAGIIFNGNENLSTERVILDYSRIPFIGRMDDEGSINSETIKRYAVKLKEKLNKIQ